MSRNYGKNDFRVRKTHLLLFKALLSLLSRKRFAKITVSDICEKSLLSRATFYQHFMDSLSTPISERIRVAESSDIPGISEMSLTKL